MVESRKFILSEDRLNFLVKRQSFHMKKETEEKSKEKEERKLSMEMTTGNYDEYFNCEICMSVVENPKECVQCNALMCEVCINKWKEKNDSCPMCRAKINLADNLNRFAQNKLNDLEFKCDTCQKNFKYETRKQHWQSCEIAPITSDSVVPITCDLVGCSKKD